jgi:hypothetical protein
MVVVSEYYTNKRWQVRDLACQICHCIMCHLRPLFPLPFFLCVTYLLACFCMCSLFVLCLCNASVCFQCHFCNILSTFSSHHFYCI